MSGRRSEEHERWAKRSGDRCTLPGPQRSHVHRFFCVSATAGLAVPLWRCTGRNRSREAEGNRLQTANEQRQGQSREGWNGSMTTRTVLRHLVIGLLFPLCLGMPHSPSPKPASAAEDAERGTVTLLEGKAKVQRGGVGNWQGCSQGMKVSAGDRLATEAESRLEIRLDDGSLLRLGASSQLDLQATGTVTKLKLWFGKLGASVKKLVNPQSKFEVETPTVVAAVRGTEFRVDVDGEEQEDPLEAGTEVAVYEGEVEVTDLAGEIEAVEENPQTYQSRRSRYAVHLRPNQRVKVARGPLLLRQFATEVTKVGILPFRAVVHTVSPSVGMVAASRFAAALSAAAKGRYQVVGPQAMQKHMVVLPAASREVWHVATVRQVARDAGVAVVIVGTVVERPSTGARFRGRAAPPQRRAFPPRRGGRAGRQVGARRTRTGGLGRGRTGEQNGVIQMLVRAIHVSSGHTLFARTLTFASSEDKQTVVRAITKLSARLQTVIPKVAVVGKVRGTTVTMKVRKATEPRVGDRYLVLKRGKFVKLPTADVKGVPRAAGVVRVVRVSVGVVSCTIVSKRGTAAIAPGDVAVRLDGVKRNPLRPLPLDPAREKKLQWFRWARSQAAARKR